MKFTYNWLKQYVDFDWSPAELAEKLTFAGIEVEDVQSLGGKIPEQVVIAQVLSSEKHPNADKLSVCRVNDGTGERQIVCGAKNYKVGDKVPLALPGAAMAAGFTIKESKLRGVMSQGMMCSAEELGLPKGEDGLLILPADAPVGKKFVEYVGPGDTVFDIEVTPNRPDWLSVIGIAREVAALTVNPLRLPAAEPVAPTSMSGLLPDAVRVDAPELCPRYTARLIRGVKIGPSPAWMKSLLEKVGMRSINNVVDVTNYVLLETGHPLHAFDYNLLKRGHAEACPSVIVRRAANGERYEAIDGSKHELSSEMLVIADAERPVALAGIMGGKNSEINDATTDVLLEAAYFNPPNIRKTSKKLGLASDSSYRFERGTDIEGLVWASNRAAALIQQSAGGQVAAGVVDVLAKPIERRRVSCRYAQVNRLLGIEVPPAPVKKIFVGLGMQVVAEGRASARPLCADGGHAEACPSDEWVEVEVPTFRVDLEREADLIEEVCRIHGVEKIPARMLPATAQVSAFDGQWDARARVRQMLTALGFHEALNQTMVADAPLKLQNPLTSDMGALRASLLPGLMQNLRTNVSRHQFDVKLFEIGRVFAADGAERLNLALAMTGRRTTGDWQRTEKVDYLNLKGALEELGLTAEIKEIPAAQAKKLDLRDAVVLAELELPEMKPVEKQYRELPKFPAIGRDMALVVDEGVTHGAIVAAIEAARNIILERVELFDIFRGGPVGPGKKSLAYSLTFRAADRTLTDSEVNAAHEQLKRAVERAVQCEIREG
jgi:phenylalanyl-tRNA synthetase beta chain